MNDFIVRAETLGTGATFGYWVEEGQIKEKNWSESSGKGAYVY